MLLDGVADGEGEVVDEGSGETEDEGTGSLELLSKTRYSDQSQLLSTYENVQALHTLVDVAGSARGEGWTARSVGKALVTASESDPIVIGKVPSLLRRTRVRLVDLCIVSLNSYDDVGSLAYLESTVIARVFTSVDGIVGSVQDDGTATSADIPSSSLFTRERDKSDVVTDFASGDSRCTDSRRDTEVTVGGLDHLTVGSFEDRRGVCRSGKERE